ncbi:MAG: hypothetical protein BMS9Abin25_0466 [Gammaproteobacteria bacterium]|nr:MAG: hypothetical protein BMS9Abin25_0466 [Gammaproteobacteria bacterium]
MKVNQKLNSKFDVNNFDLRDGWLPAHIKYQKGEALVELVHFPSCRLQEKFLHWDLNKCHEKVYITMKELQKMKLPDVTLSGQIYHLSRVGSTLVSEMFRVLDYCIVLSEPQCISDIFLDPFDTPEHVKLNSIRTLLAVFSHVLGGGKKVIIKWSSWKILHIEMLNRLYGNVPGCFVVRDPVEVLVALAGKPPGWMRRKKMISLIEKDGGKEKSLYWASMNNALLGKVDYYSELSFPEYAAGILAEMCKAAMISTSLVILDYTDIRDKVPTSLATAFSINPTPEEIEKMQAVCVQNAKVGGQNTFKPDTERKQIEATPMIRDAAETIVKPAYSKLLATFAKH